MKRPLTAGAFSVRILTWLTACAMFLAGVSYTYALSTEIRVTPNHLEQDRYVFSVSTNPVTKGVAYQVTIAAKKGGIDSSSDVGVSVVTHRSGDGDKGRGTEIVPAEPLIPVTLKTNDRVWTATFTVSHEQLKQTGLCFVFTELDYLMIKGERVAADSATFYEINLRDFLSPAGEQVGNRLGERRFDSIVVEFGPPPPYGFLIDFDCAFAWMGGEARNPGTNFAPGVFVYSKAHARWLQILQVNTAGATFGKSPPQALIQAPWDFTGLASKPFVPLPINSGGVMHYPDKVIFDEGRDAFVLLLDSNWKMNDQITESARTTLLLPKKDLIEAFDYYSGSKSGARDPQGEGNGNPPPGPGTTRPASHHPQW